MNATLSSGNLVFNENNVEYPILRYKRASSRDLNDITEIGIYTINPNAHMPTNIGYSYMLVISYDGNFVRQILMPLHTNDIYSRVFVENTWSAWAQFTLT